MRTVRSGNPSVKQIFHFTAIYALFPPKMTLAVRRSMFEFASGRTATDFFRKNWSSGDSDEVSHCGTVVTRSERDASHHSCRGIVTTIEGECHVGKNKGKKASRPASFAVSTVKSSDRPSLTNARVAASRAAIARKRRRRTIAATAAGALIFTSAVVLAFSNHPSSAGYRTTIAGWSLPRLGESGRVSLSQFRGRPVVVNFFASWCTVCASELPVFAHDGALLRGRVDVVEVNALETGNGPSFARQYNLVQSVPAVLSDVGGSQGDGLYQALGGTGTMPMTAFYDTHGHLLTTHVGGFDSTTLANELHQLYGVIVTS